MAYSVKRGPLAGIQFASERQYRNARRYTLAHGTIPEPLALAKAYQSQYEREQKIQKRSGISRTDFDRMRQYFAVRAAQYEAASLDALGRQHLTTRELETLNLAPKSEFMKFWDDAARAGFKGAAMDRLMLYAGMRDTGGKHKDSKHWQTYKRLISWYAIHEPDSFVREPWRNMPRTKTGRWIYPKGFTAHD